MFHTPRLRSTLLACASATAISGLSAPAFAQSGSNVIEELVVTAQRREEALQDVPVAVSAFSAESLKAQRLDAGGNLVLSVPNVNFSRGNFGGYNFQIRGIGSKVVGAGGTAGVSFHVNNSPISANRLADAEFYDVERVEVLRGPQGTLYGRNASGGVINVITAKPTDILEASITGEYGTYSTVRAKGFLNVPLGETLAVRVAGFYLQRDGFGDNIYTGNDIDNRDLSSVRTTVSWRPIESLRADLMWEHFNEKDNRSRVGKQLCITDPGRATLNGLPVAAVNQGYLSQGCLGGSLYQDAAYGAVNSAATLGGIFAGLVGLTGSLTDPGNINLGKVQNRNLHDIESSVDPVYQGQQDFIQLAVAADLGENFTVTSLTTRNVSEGYSIEDYNRIIPTRAFNATPNPVNAFAALGPTYAAIYGALFPGGVVQDPQVGGSNLFRTYDRGAADSEEHTEELRLQSNFAGPFNFSVGGIYISNRNNGADYFVLSNGLTAFAQVNAALGGGVLGGPVYIDPNPDPDGTGHNYYISHSESRLRSRAVFGEVYWQASDALKLTAGLRVTEDKLRANYYPILLMSTVNGGRGFPNPTIQTKTTQATTGRLAIDWSPELSFTDQTLVYASYSRGYKGGGFNTPCDATAVTCAGSSSFDPEYVDAFEIGTKNTLAGGSMILNATGFYYDYQGYQISKILNKASTNENVDAKIWGLELESLWEPIDNLRLNANVGYLQTEIQSGSSIDTLYRTQGDPNLVVVKDTGGGNCVVNAAGFTAAMLATPFALRSVCNGGLGVSGAGLYDYSAYPGMNTAPVQAAAGGGLPARTVLVGQGIPVSLEGKRLPNSPEWTLSLGAQYVWNLPNWSITLRGDYYRQGETYARIYNTVADHLESWENVNATLTLDNESLGLNVQVYVKNLFDDTPITDIYVTDDSSGLFTNVFSLDPREIGISLTKRF
ncbi:MAG: TonB-dependent receptor [Phenylobacterium sp.]|uniref:TonB-dependent receptor n=1 Tax=Phenylobacterium sp. TaxID=1871053 RepID=UPI00391BE764